MAGSYDQKMYPGAVPDQPWTDPKTGIKYDKVGYAIGYDINSKSGIDANAGSPNPTLRYMAMTRGGTPVIRQALPGQLNANPDGSPKYGAGGDPGPFYREGGVITTYLDPTNKWNLPGTITNQNQLTPNDIISSQATQNTDLQKAYDTWKYQPTTGFLPTKAPGSFIGEVVGPLMAGFVGGGLGGAILGPAIGTAAGMGAGSGFSNALVHDASFSDALKQGAIGGAVGFAGGQISNAMNTTSGTWMEGISPETLKAAGYSSSEISALQQAATSGSVFGSNGWNTTGNKAFDRVLNNSVTGAAKGSLSSLMIGSNPLTGALKGGLSGGLNTAIQGTANSLTGNNGSNWLGNSAIGLGSGMLTSGLLSNLFSNQSTSGNQTSNGTTGGGTMADSSIAEWGNALAPFLSAYNTYTNKENTKDAYAGAQQLVTTPSADQQIYRTQLASLMRNPGQMNSSPVYQAMLDQGTNAVNRTAAAKGMLGSGNRLAELMNMGQKTAAQFYFPQQQALSVLSGVAGDSAGRALAAQAMISGNNANMGLSNQLYDSLLQGAGVKSPSQQLIDALVKPNSGAAGTTALGTLIDKAKGLFSGDTYTGGNDFNDWFSGVQSNPVDNFWAASGSSPTALTDYTNSAFMPVDTYASNDWLNSLGY